MELFYKATQIGERVAIVDDAGRHTYQQLLASSSSVGAMLLEGSSDLHEERVAFLVPPSFEYAAVQWGIWRSGGVAVPLAMVHPKPELEYVIDDTEASVIVVHPDFSNRVRDIAEERKLRLILTTR